ncbi:MAG TPA: amidohydrolase family protein [Candidatus Polarisedimenticolaceae bacterium]
MRAAAGFLVVALAADASAQTLAPEAKAPAVVLVKDATVWTQGPAGVLENTDVLVREGKIAAIGRALPAPAGAFVVEAGGRHVTPGLIDAHSHTAIRGGVNEGSNNVTAEVRIADVVDPDDPDVYRALAGGVTTSNLLHGSANAIGGQNAVVKMRWRSTPAAMLVDGAPAGIKFALGENPKRSNFRAPGGAVRYPATRMGVMESIRERFLAARDYAATWAAWNALPAGERAKRVPPRRDLQLEAIAEILEGDRLIHCHAYRQDEMLALVRLVETFSVRIATFQHVLEGYKIADEIAAHGAGASTFSDWWAFKLEAYDAIPYNGALMRDRGVLVSFNSDSSELARRMNLEAAKAVKYGAVPEADALAFVTLNPARQLGIDRRVGTLEVGKDADLVVWSGHPLSVYAVADQTWVDGRLEFDRTADVASRAAVEAARAEAVAKALGRAPEPPATAIPAGAQPGPGPAPAWKDRLASRGGGVSIVGATVHPVSGPPIENGTVSFREGRIVAVGAGLPPLPGATVVDGRGRHLYPGLLDASSSLGRVEISSVAGSVDVGEIGDLNPEVATAIAVNPDSELLGVARANGITHALGVPEGGIVSGSSAWMRLDGWTWEDLEASGPVAMHVRWPSYAVRRGPGAPSEDDQRRERELRLTALRRLFEDARAYARAKGAAPDGRRIDVDPKLEAMLPVVDGRLPVVVHASQARQIRAALDWAGKEQIRIVLASPSSGDAWRLADALAARAVPVLLEGVLQLPAREDDPYDAAYAAAAKLRAAGVRVAIASGGGGGGAWTARNLPYHAAMAAAFGLPKDDALRAVTLHAAEILGVASTLGSIEVGKSASLILTDGDPLEIRTRVGAAWIDGRPASLEDNRHDRLYRRYASRPRPGAR